MNTIETISKIRSKLRKEPMSIFIIYGKVHALRANSQFCNEMSKKYVGMMLGTYNKSVTDDMLFEDLEAM